jgi:hypothetical protein
VFDMLPSDDARSWALRLAHFGVLGGLAGLAVVVLLCLQNAYLIYSVRMLRADVRNLNLRLKRTLEQR